jgi:protein-L-isoaspartate O-methyltransferase
MIIKEAVPLILARLINQLKSGGRLIFPVGLPNRG